MTYEEALTTIDVAFPEGLLEQAALLAARPWTPEPWRRDLTHMLCVTIDDPDSRDLDDALSCVPREEGGWRLGVHIADPSARVAAGTPLDEWARDRGTSLYLPTGTIPMFPRDLSEAAMSLVVGELRPAMSTIVEIDRDLNVVDVQVLASMIKVDRRLSYDEVDEVLEQDARAPVDAMLHDLAFLTSELFFQREEQGAMSFDIPEAKVTVTGVTMASGELVMGIDAEVVVAPVDGESPARTLVSEAMILASANMARFCHDHEIPVIYRSQAPPEEELFDEHVLAMPEGIPRYFAMRRKMRPGSITTYPEPHFGLGLEMYVQATSPIRRYADLICQRQVKAFLTGEPLPYSPDEILEIASDVERTTREALGASRSMAQYWAYVYLEQHRDEPFEAVVLDHRDDRVAFVFLNKLAISVKCRMNRRHEPGDVIQVSVDRVEPRQGFLRIRQM